MSKITNMIWFSDRASIGIIITINSTGEEAAYISAVPGKDEILDAIYIAQWGSSFPLEEAKSLAKKIGLETDIEYS